MEITKETLQAHIASMEKQLAAALARQANAAEEAAMVRGGIVACNQLLAHLEIPEPETPLTPGLMTCAVDMQSCPSEECLGQGACERWPLGDEKETTPEE